jgi:hypothetical protein
MDELSRSQIQTTCDPSAVGVQPEHRLALQQERGVWVFHCGVTLTQNEANKAIERLRSERASYVEGHS